MAVNQQQPTLWSTGFTYRVVFLGVFAIAIAGLRELAFWWNDRH